MKMTKKKVFASALAVCMIAILSFGTLAWFNATDEVTNTFKVATNENDTDPTFSIKVSETDYETGTETTDGVIYWNVLPGDVIAKNPKIENTGDYDQWIRVSVTMTKANYWKQFGGSLKFTDLFEGSTYGLASNVGNTAEKWLLVANEVVADADGNAVWYLYLNTKLSPKDYVTVFEKVKIDEDFTLEEVLSLGGEFTITVKADALQSDNTGNNAVEAFAKVGWTEGAAFVDKD